MFNELCEAILKDKGIFLKTMIGGPGSNMLGGGRGNLTLEINSDNDDQEEHGDEKDMHLANVKHVAGDGSFSAYDQKPDNDTPTHRISPSTGAININAGLDAAI